MEAPLPAQPDPSVSGAPQQRRQASQKPKQRRRTPSTHFTRALRWARTVPIPTRYPDGKKVYDPPGLRLSLVELAVWCSEEYGYEPAPPLRAVEGSDYPGFLAVLGVNINIHRLRMSALGRLGLVTKVEHGRGTKPNRWGKKRKTRWTRYRLNIEPLVTTFQPALLSEENRTEHSLPMSGEHVKQVLPMSGEHVQSGLHMSGEHVKQVLPMSEKHGQTSRPLLDMTSERDETSEEAPSDITMHHSKTGGEGGGLFCSDFLIPAFENVGLLGFTEAALAFIEPAAARFAEYHGEPPGRDVADYIAARLVKFIEQEGIDVSAEPHRILSANGGYLRNTLVPSVLEAGMSLRFERPSVQDDPEPEEQPRANVKVDWEVLHTAHVPNRHKSYGPGQIWDAALGELQEQVARPAFETWLRDTQGVGITDDDFYVGTANKFISEMLEHRMYPLIERAVEQVVGAPLSIRFIETSGSVDQSECPLCRAS